MNLWIAVVLSALLVALANLSVRRPGWRSLPFLATGTGFSLLPGYFLPLALLFTLLIVAHPFVYFMGVRRFFPILSASIAAFSLGITGSLIWSEHARFAELRRDYPFESLEGRLPPEPATRNADLPEEAEMRLAHQEDLLDSRGVIYRRKQLQRVHENHIELFLNRPGFGWERMSEIPHRNDIQTRDRKEYSGFENPAEQERVQKSSTRKTDWFDLHQSGVFEFLNPSGFGYIKDREHVAGFQSHQFRQPPVLPVLTEQVQSIDLVSLLLHETPVAYVSDELPQMDKLRKAPTRPLNDFESAGLAKLRKGEDLVVESSSSKMRMLGSIRRTKQCMECHGGHRGDLLGAFSYTLR